jgi:hydroxyacylglutathione hydrolase
VLLQQFVVDGLGHLSTLVADTSSGVAAVVDPRRDVDVYLEAARKADVRISHVVETHLHNDYVSGGRELVAQTGAEHVIGTGAQLATAHRGVDHDDTFDVGLLRFSALATPGHTPEHVAYAVADRSRATDRLLLFTGGSLLVGSVGRTDLLGAANATPYAEAMFHSLHGQILPHDDFVGVYPTHGAGSLCSTDIASTPFSTVGFERRHNPLLQIGDVDQFARRLLRGQPTVPRYFARMRPLNQAGPRLLGATLPPPRPLTVDEAAAAVARGAVVVDLRDPAAHAVAHIPDSLSIPAGSSFGTWLGWLVDLDRPIVLVLDQPSDWDDAVRQAIRIGHDDIVGHLRDGVRGWQEAGRDVASTGRMNVDELAGAVSAGAPGSPLVIDVRQLTEYATAHVPGAVHIAAGSLPERLHELAKDRPIATICASGYRASVAASLLRAEGFTDVSWVADGVNAWRAKGYPTAHGEPAGPDVPTTAREESGEHQHAAPG